VKADTAKPPLAYFGFGYFLTSPTWKEVTMRQYCVVALLVLVFTTCDARAGLILNINARTYSVDTPLLVDLGAGDWVLTPVNTAMGGAYTAWDAWGTSQKWLNFYVIQSESIPQTIVGDWGTWYSTPAEAFDHASPFAFSLSQPETVRLSTTDSSDVAWDNQGGLSLYIDVEPTGGGHPATVPAPAGIWLAVVGLAGVRWLRRSLTS